MHTTYSDLPVSIVGAGISGLSLAVMLHRKGMRTVVFEASSEPGGNVKTVRSDTYRFDTGPNSLLVDAQVLNFLSEAGVNELLMPPSVASQNRYILWQGKPALLPTSPVSLLGSNFFSWHSKWRILTEFFRKPVHVPHENLAAFVRRRFCDEVVEKVLKPFVAGIYAGDPEQLLVSEAFPQLAEYEQKYGSVLRGLVQSSRAGSRKQSYSFKGGMQTLAYALAKQLPVSYGSRLTGIRKWGHAWQLLFENGDCIATARVVLALPAHQTAQLINDLYPQAAGALRRVYYPPVCVVHTAFAKNAVGWLPEGFGMLHPKAAQTFTAGSIWSSSIFPDVCPADQVLFTSFVGGAMYTEHTTLPPSEIVNKVVEELQRIYQISAAPLVTHVTCWQQAIPQYDQHIAAAKLAAAHLQKEGIWCHSNWLHGISLADCIRASMALAEKF
ncbi:MAG: protoporphyrinogen oxidase [Cytophagales bacterium]|nr:protoporphyrinogen oxidase [Bernardetiaceae bacterium]MDW8205201.1 protoporphyrinogen oxidase [Cytophagales bacterium]